MSRSRPNCQTIEQCKKGLTIDSMFVDKYTPKACWTNDPESKGKVESSVKYVKRDFHYGCSYNGLGDLNRQALEWCNEVANCKIHSTTGEVRRNATLNETDFRSSSL